MLRTPTGQAMTQDEEMVDNGGGEEARHGGGEGVGHGGGEGAGHGGGENDVDSMQ